MPREDDDATMHDDAEEVVVQAEALRAAAGVNGSAAASSEAPPRRGRPPKSKTGAGSDGEPDRSNRFETDGLFRWQEIIDEKYRLTGNRGEAFDIQVRRINPIPDEARQTGYVQLGTIYGANAMGTDRISAPNALYDQLVRQFHMNFWAPATYELLFFDKLRGVIRTRVQLSLPAPDDIRKSNVAAAQTFGAEAMPPSGWPPHGSGSGWGSAPPQPPAPPHAAPPAVAGAPPPPASTPIPAGATPEEVMRIVNADRENTLAWAERFRAMFSQGAGAMGAVPMSPPPTPDEDAALDKMLKRFETMKKLGIAFGREDMERAAEKAAATTAASFEARLKAVEAGHATPPAASTTVTGAGAAATPSHEAPKTFAARAREFIAEAKELKVVRDALDEFLGAGASDAVDDATTPEKKPAESKYHVEPVGVDGFGYRTRKPEFDGEGNEIEPPPDSLFDKATNLFIGSPKLQETAVNGVMGLGKVVVTTAADIARKVAGVPAATGTGAGAAKDDDDGYPQ